MDKEIEIKEYVKVLNNGYTYSTHPKHKEYGCINFSYGESPRNGIICRIIKRVMINENLPYHAGMPGASIDYNGQHYIIEEDGFAIATKEEYNAQFQPQELIQQQINQPEIKIEQKMKVKCINQGDFKNITLGNDYDVYLDNGEMWSVVTNDLSVRNYSKKYFEIIPNPIIEDEDEIGVEENMEDEINITFNGEGDIAYEVNGNDATLEFYEVASNCGVKSYHGINYLFENCDCNKDLFKKVIEAIIEKIIERNNSCMLIFSTNSSYMDIWTALDEAMDFSSKIVENPNSDMDVRLWIKYTN
jgi:hypothetical protein